MGDQYKWVLSSTGYWDGVGNWEDLTTSANPATTYPGITDGATIDGPANSAAFLPIVGPGNAATFSAFGNVELTGSTFTFTSLDVGSSSSQAFLDIGASTSVAVTAASLFSSTLQISGAGAAFSDSGTLALDTQMNVDNGGSVLLAGLVMDQPYQSLQVDASSIVEIGAGGGGAAAGALTVDNNATLSGTNGTVAAVVVDNGTILSQGGYLRFNDAVSGTGQAVVASGGYISFGSTETVPITFAGTGGELEFSGVLPSGTIAGFGVDDKLYAEGIAFDAAAYTATGAATGYLTLTQAGASVGTIALSGTFAGTTFVVVDDGFGDSSIVVAAGTAGAGSNPPSAGTTTTDSYTWNQTAGGAWGTAANWLDGGSAASVAPGTNDIVSIPGSTTSFQVVSGTGNSRSLAVSGNVALGGSFATGALTLGSATAETQLALLPGTVVTATGVAVDDEGNYSITLDVDGGGLDDSGSLNDEGSVVVTDGGSLSTTGVSMETDYPLEVDASAEMVVGSAAASIGFLTVAAGAEISGYGSIDAAMIDDGTIFASGSDLWLVGPVTGTGTLLVGGTGMVLDGSVAATDTIAFAGPTGTLTVKGALPAAAIAGFAPGEAIAISTVAFNAVSYASGTLTLMENGGSVGVLAFSGTLPPAEQFLVLPSSHQPAYNEIVLTAGTIGAGTTAAAAGTTGADHYTWISTVGGSWNAVANWNDTTTSPTVVPPGSNDIVTIGVGDSAYQAVSGQGDAATLTTSGQLVLGGDFDVGTLNATQSGYTDALVVPQGATLIANSASLAVGTLAVDGAAALFESAGTVAVSSYLLNVVNGGTFAAAGLTSSNYLTISVDATSAVEIGGSSDLTTGKMVVDAGTTLTGDITIAGTLVDNGVINTGSEAQVTFNGPVTGTGVAAIGPSSFLYVASTIGNGVTIDFNGSGGTLVIQESGSEIEFAGAPGGASEGGASEGGALDGGASQGGASEGGGATSGTSVGGGGLGNGGQELVSGPIYGFAPPDMIEFENTPISSASFVQTGDHGTLTISNNGTAVAALDLYGDYGSSSFVVENTPFGGYVLVGAAPPACFAAGTRLTAADGLSARVEDIAVGDRLRTADGRAAPVRWVGRSVVDPAGYADPEKVLPIRVRAGAFGEGLPIRDLLLSPDHAIAVSDASGTALVPAHLLVNGASILREDDWRGPIAYHHVELDRHDLVLAEGLATESYLDTGNRGAFAGEAVRALHPSFAFDAREASLRIWAERGCAPLLLQGDRLIAAHRSLLERAGEAFAALTEDPGVWLDVDGMSLSPDVVDEGYACFIVPEGAARLRLRSRAIPPSALDRARDDHRRLGVPLARVLHEGAEIPLDAAAWTGGVHPPEDGWRWTDGDATLRLPPSDHATVLEIWWMPGCHRWWREAA